MSVGLRPQRSLSVPPTSGPAMQPNNALAIANPTPSGPRPNSGSRKSFAPEMIDRS